MLLKKKNSSLFPNTSISINKILCLTQCLSPSSVSLFSLELWCEGQRNGFLYIVIIFHSRIAEQLRILLSLQEVQVSNIIIRKREKKDLHGKLRQVVGGLS